MGSNEVITKLPNSEQSYKGKVKTRKYINKTKSVNNRKTVKTVMTLTWYKQKKTSLKLKQLKKDQDKMSLDELWNIFKTNVQETIHKHIPTKTIGNKSRLPWVNNQLKKVN